LETCKTLPKKEKLIEVSVMLTTYIQIRKGQKINYEKREQVHTALLQKNTRPVELSGEILKREFFVHDHQIFSPKIYLVMQLGWSPACQAQLGSRK